VLFNLCEIEVDEGLALQSSPSHASPLLVCSLGVSNRPKVLSRCIQNLKSLFLVKCSIFPVGYLDERESHNYYCVFALSKVACFFVFVCTVAVPVPPSRPTSAQRTGLTAVHNVVLLYNYTTVRYDVVYNVSGNATNGTAVIETRQGDGFFIIRKDALYVDDTWTTISLQTYSVGVGEGIGHVWHLNCCFV